MVRHPAEDSPSWYRLDPTLRWRFEQHFQFGLRCVQNWKSKKLIMLQSKLDGDAKLVVQHPGVYEENEKA